jgi:hypothetical protein
VRYPTISTDACVKLANEFLREGHRPVTEGEIDHAGKGPDLDVSGLESVAMSCATALENWQAEAAPPLDRDQLEGALAGLLHRAIHTYPTLVLDDPGFWRFVALAHLWEVTYWREQGSFDSLDPAKYLRYIDAKAPAECVVTRMFLRARAVVRGDDDYSLAAGVPRGVDFWRSHVLRVGVSYAPPLARALAKEQATHHMPTDDLRAYARRLNRSSTNLVLPLLDDDEAEALIERLKTPT